MAKSYRQQFDAEVRGPIQGFWEDAYILWLEAKLEAAENKNALHEAAIASMREEILALIKETVTA